jgi:hypothetical protein
MCWQVKCRHWHRRQVTVDCHLVPHSTHSGENTQQPCVTKYTCSHYESAINPWPCRASLVLISGRLLRPKNVFLISLRTESRCAPTKVVGSDVYKLLYRPKSELNWIKHLNTSQVLHGARGGVVFEALRYKPEGREFDSRCHWIFSLT